MWAREVEGRRRRRTQANRPRGVQLPGLFRPARGGCPATQVAGGINGSHCLVGSLTITLPGATELFPDPLSSMNPMM